MAQTLIDYDVIWQEQLKSFDHSSDLAKYWNSRAQTFDSIYRTSTYSTELLNLMELLPEYTVLDVACGAGAAAIPLAKKVRRVTALDISELMLENLKKRALQENINNIKLVNRDWNRVDIDNDIEQHDVVLVSRSLPGAQLSETLRKFDRSAARTPVI